MMTIAAISDPGKAAGYFEGMAKEDSEIDEATRALKYFSEIGEPPGRWVSGSGHFGHLAGDVVQAGELEQLLHGGHPGTGEVLVPGANGFHQPGWDATFSAPKSVSSIWAVADPELRAATEARSAGTAEIPAEYDHGNGDSVDHPRVGVLGKMSCATKP